MSRALILPLIALPCLVACGSLPEGEFPSLAKRPYENTDPIAAPPVSTAPAPTSLPAALASKVGALETRARKADDQFRAALPTAQARAAAARGTARSSDRWVSAQIALSRLDRSRADAVAALAELDVLLLGQLDEGLSKGSEGYAPLMEPAQQRISAIVAAQNSTIDRLFGMIG